MKKSLILFVLLLSYACAKNYTSYCNCPMPKNTSGGAIMSFSGLNFFSRKIIESQIEKEFKKQTDSKFNVKIKTFKNVNIASGYFGSFRADCKNYAHDDIYLSDVLIESICPYNKVIYKGEDVGFYTDTPFKFSARISQDNLDKMSKKFFNNKMILSSSIKIRKDDLYFKYKIAPLGLFPFSLSFGAVPKVKNNKIYFSEYESLNKYSSYIKQLTNFQFDYTKNSKIKVNLENIYVKDSNIYIDGFIIIPKVNS